MHCFDIERPMIQFLQNHHQNDQNHLPVFLKQTSFEVLSLTLPKIKQILLNYYIILNYFKYVNSILKIFNL